MLRYFWEYIKYIGESKDYGYGKLANLVCRIRGHDDVVWYTSSGLEPDMHCQYCNQDLG
jgi:hypothetical protein